MLALTVMYLLVSKDLNLTANMTVPSVPVVDLALPRTVIPATATTASFHRTARFIVCVALQKTLRIAKVALDRNNVLVVHILQPTTVLSRQSFGQFGCLLDRMGRQQIASTIFACRNRADINHMIVFFNFRVQHGQIVHGSCGIAASPATQRSRSLPSRPDLCANERRLEPGFGRHVVSLKNGKFLVSYIKGEACCFPARLMMRVLWNCSCVCKRWHCYQKICFRRAPGNKIV